MNEDLQRRYGLSFPLGNPETYMTDHPRAMGYLKFTDPRTRVEIVHPQGLNNATEPEP